MSKKYKIETTGDKVEVVEVVPDICKNYTVEHQRECGINSTRYATIPSDRDFWLAKQGEVFGEECFELSYTAISIEIYAIPRKEDDVKPSELKWRLLKNGLPTDKQQVLFVTKYERRKFGVFYELDQWFRPKMFISSDGGFFECDQIAVWMPYPDLPPNNI